MMADPSSSYITRGGDKLLAALEHFQLDMHGLICADLGSHAGGFVDCLLSRGASRVYSIDTGYGILAYRLRKDSRVVVMERTNALHAVLPEPVNLVTIDLGWTPQGKILPHVATLIRPGGWVLTLIKPQYEAPSELLSEGVLPDEMVPQVLPIVLAEIARLGWQIVGTLPSPLRGHAGNQEHFALLKR